MKYSDYKNSLSMSAPSKITDSWWDESPSHAAPFTMEELSALQQAMVVADVDMKMLLVTLNTIAREKSVP